MMREKTVLPRPTLGQLIPSVARQTINWLIAGRRNPKHYYVRDSEGVTTEARFYSNF